MLLIEFKVSLNASKYCYYGKKYWKALKSLSYFSIQYLFSSACSDIGFAAKLQCNVLKSNHCYTVRKLFLGLKRSPFIKTSKKCPPSLKHQKLSPNPIKESTPNVWAQFRDWPKNKATSWQALETRGLCLYYLV